MYTSLLLLFVQRVPLTYMSKFFIFIFWFAWSL